MAVTPGTDPLKTVPLAACPHCGGTAFRALPFEYRFLDARLPGGECRRCGLRGLLVQPAAHEFLRLYSREYFAGGDVRCGHVGDYFAERPALLADGARLAAQFEALLGGQPGRLLEVGAASGAVLEAAQARGWSVLGIEYSEDAAAEARRHGVEVRTGGLSDAALPAGSFDIVFLGDVLEHVPDPSATLREVARVLIANGALVLRGPMTTNSIARRLGLSFMNLLGRTWALNEPPYHLWEFGPKTLRKLVRSAGFEIESFRQAKVPPSWSGKRGTPAGLAAFVLDAINAAWTAATGTLGDRCEVIARRRAP